MSLRGNQANLAAALPPAELERRGLYPLRTRLQEPWAARYNSNDLARTPVYFVNYAALTPHPVMPLAQFLSGALGIQVV